MRQNERPFLHFGGAARGASLFIAAILLGSCQAKAEDRLLASELVYFKQERGWTKSIQIDPWLAPRPDLARHLRSERIKTMEEGAECPVDWGCEESSEFHLFHRGERLVSIMENQSRDGGGAHPISGVSDYLYDLKLGERIRFGDLFTSWAAARPVLQRAFCKELGSNYKEAIECPDIQGQAISLVSFPFTGKIEAFYVETQDYALGYYALGTAAIRLDVTAPLHSMLKPEYQDQFKVAADPE